MSEVVYEDDDFINRRIQLEAGGCCMNFIFIIIILLALIFHFSMEIIICSLFYLMFKNVFNVSVKYSLLASLLLTILVCILW